MNRRWPHPVRRGIDRFVAEPGSIGNAVRVITAVTLAVVLVASLVIWVFDARDFPDYGAALWFALQTVTTVGYGDLVPTSAVGRVIGGLVMLVAIGFTTVVTALITSIVVEAAQARRRAAQDLAALDERDANERILERLDAIDQRLARVERALAGERAEPD